jgi:NAD(P)-dependent dehydrogenase (short-subunit alcohol dehydrogenase family)
VQAILAAMSDARGVAFVTGASRGIGKAIAVHLARAGYDVAIAARTVHEGEAREHSSTVQRSDTSPLPGSLDSTAALVEAEDRRALPVFCDITDRTTLGASVTTVLERWGRIDVLVNNARYIGPGHMDRLLDTPVPLLDLHLEANVTSSAGTGDPPAPAGEGGWGLGYGMSKGAVHRLAGIVKLEHEQDGVVAYNLHPGFIATERMAQDMAAFGFDASAGAPPDVIGAAAAWLATASEAREYNGRWVEGQELCAELGLLPGWPRTGA